MDLERQQIDVFLEKCDDVMRSKFIIADTKISELLKSIATSDLLYAFFREITKDFDYAAAQRKYMNYAPEGSVTSGNFFFPQILPKNSPLFFAFSSISTIRRSTSANFYRNIFTRTAVITRVFTPFPIRSSNPLKI